MTSPHFIAAQINPIVGAFKHNIDLMLGAAQPYKDDAGVVLVFPELAITGYSPEDLLLRPHFIDEAMAALHALVQYSGEFKCSFAVGGVFKEGPILYNAAFFISGGKLVHVHKKSCLPNYGVFDERRYFGLGSTPVVFEHLGKRLGMLICEDAWFDHNFKLLKAQGVDTALILNASPFEVGKQEFRVERFARLAEQHALEILYVNIVGGQDDLVFDGASFMVSAKGELVHQSPAFEASALDMAAAEVAPYPAKEEAIYKAIGLGLSDYLKKNSISDVVLGLSGGIDSAIVATLAADVLGAEHVHAVLLPSEFTSDDSNQDAEALAQNLGIKTSIVPVGAFIDTAENALIPALAHQGANTADWRSNLAIGGNLQARFRANILMAYSNAMGSVLLNTSNKSEIAVGYSTMYGDSCGAYAPLKDVYKTDVYALANWCNSMATSPFLSSQRRLGSCESNAVTLDDPGLRRDDSLPLIPQNIIDKAPTAELKPEQKDSDQLPDYDVLDQILHALVEERLGVDAVADKGFNRPIVEKIAKLLRQSEYKRRQGAPGPKVSSMIFAKDWRMPMSNGYEG